MTLGFILLVILILVVAGVVLYFINKYIPAPWKWIGIGIVLLALIIWFWNMVAGGSVGMNTRIH